jgi:hypothetical protein
MLSLNVAHPRAGDLIICLPVSMPMREKGFCVIKASPSPLRHNLLLFLIACTALSHVESCAAADRSRDGVATTRASWKIEYELSGGFAGVRKKLTLSSSGALQAVDERMNKTIEAAATPAQLADVEEALAKIGTSGTATRPSFGSRCADCFQHNVVVIRSDKELRFAFDDVSLKDAEQASLVRVLSSLLNQTLAQSGTTR